MALGLATHAATAIGAEHWLSIVDDNSQVLLAVTLVVCDFAQPAFTPNDRAPSDSFQEALRSC